MASSFAMPRLASGNSEIRNWIALAGAVPHLLVEWLEYIPVHRSPAGTGLCFPYGARRGVARSSLPHEFCRLDPHNAQQRGAQGNRQFQGAERSEAEYSRRRRHIDRNCERGERAGNHPP